MRRRPLIRFCLIASLLFSQLAASVHVVGHLHEYEHQHAHEHAHAHAHAHEHEHEHEPESEQEAEVGADCAIYHVHAALQGCLTGGVPAAVGRFTATTRTVAATETVASDAPDNGRIRGPPSIS